MRINVRSRKSNKWLNPIRFVVFVTNLRQSPFPERFQCFLYRVARPLLCPQHSVCVWEFRINDTKCRIWCNAHRTTVLSLIWINFWTFFVLFLTCSDVFETLHNETEKWLKTPIKRRNRTKEKRWRRQNWIKQKQFCCFTQRMRRNENGI